MYKLLRNLFLISVPFQLFRIALFHDGLSKYDDVTLQKHYRLQKHYKLKCEDESESPQVSLPMGSARTDRWGTQWRIRNAEHLSLRGRDPAP